MDKAQSDRVALMWMAVTVLIWGSGWVMMKGLVPYIGPFDLVALRYAVGFLTLLVLVLVLRRPLRFPPFWLTMGIAVFQTTAYQCLVQMALVAGGTGRVVMVAYTMPFWVALFAWVLVGDRPSRRHWIGFIPAALGLAAVIQPWQGLGGLGPSLLALGGGMSWALGTLFGKMLFERSRPDVLSLTMWQMLLGTLLALPFGWLLPQPAIVWSGTMMLGVLYLGVLSSAAAWGLWLMVVSRIHPTVAGMAGLGVPVVAVAGAWIALGERPQPIEQVGMLLMMVGLVVVSWTPARRAPRGVNAA